MIVLGIDPGTARLGYGVIDTADGSPAMIDYGIAETHPTESMPERLLQLYSNMRLLLAEHDPDVMAVEKLFFARNVTTALAVGQARGVVLLAAAERGIPVREYSPSEIKHAVVGYGKADKNQIQEMVRIILGLDHIPRPDDAADALAIAVCDAHMTSGYGAYAR
ncbi:MAG: crossover junction endodeoxyribonuclease RuvC [Thermomicrobiales bacterium]